MEGNSEKTSTKYIYDSNYYVKLELVSIEGILNYFDSFEYDDTGDLWKKTRFTPDSLIQSFTIFKHFTNGITKETFYNNNSEITGYKTLLFKNDHYDQYMQITGWTDYSFINGKIDKISEHDAYNNLKSFRQYQYYE